MMDRLNSEEDEKQADERPQSERGFREQRKRGREKLGEKTWESKGGITGGVNSSCCSGLSQLMGPLLLAVWLTVPAVCVLQQLQPVLSSPHQETQLWIPCGNWPQTLVVFHTANLWPFTQIKMAAMCQQIEYREYGCHFRTGGSVQESAGGYQVLNHKFSPSPECSFTVRRTGVLKART